MLSLFDTTSPPLYSSGFLLRKKLKLEHLFHLALSNQIPASLSDFRVPIPSRRQAHFEPQRLFRGFSISRLILRTREIVPVEVDLREPCERNSFSAKSIAIEVTLVDPRQWTPKSFCIGHVLLEMFTSQIEVQTRCHDCDDYNRSPVFGSILSGRVDGFLIQKLLYARCGRLRSHMLVVPVLLYSIYVVKRQRFELHKKLQLFLGLALLLAVTAFEVDLQLVHGGWENIVAKREIPLSDEQFGVVQQSVVGSSRVRRLNARPMVFHHSIRTQTVPETTGPRRPQPAPQETRLGFDDRSRADIDHRSSLLLPRDCVLNGETTFNSLV